MSKLMQQSGRGFFRPGIWMVLAGLVGGPAWGAGEIDFNRDIRPILSDKCYQCHGADADSREAGLRLDLRDSAIAEHDSGQTIVPGDPDASELMRRVESKGDDRMPPESANKTLSPEQAVLLRRWIEQGANYASHWSFEPVHRPPVPSVQHANQVRNPIDAFVLQRLEAEGIAPSPEASRETLIRRLYQDLLGLLPSPEETAAFVQDTDPKAYEKLVDSLLANPHYGERWGRHWLDQARYADSHGYTIDGERIMWPYRDWVIQAFNRDLPFDQFTIEQLAGDLLDEPTKAQLVATAFHRNTTINQEGGVKTDQYRHEAIIDRVNTTGAVWMGLTIGCAQCHTHKFDPIQHDEYYQLYAFFNGCQDANNTGPTVGVLTGEMFGFTPKQQVTLAQIEELRQRSDELTRIERSALIDKRPADDWKWQKATFGEYHCDGTSTFRQLPDQSLISNLDGTPNDAYHITFEPPSNKSITAIRLHLLPDPSLPKGGAGTGPEGEFLLTDVEVWVDNLATRFEKAWSSAAAPGATAELCIDNDPKTGWTLSPEQRGEVQTLTLSFSELLRHSGGVVHLVLRHDAGSQQLLGRFAIEISNEPLPKVEAAAGSELAAIQKELRQRTKEMPGGAKVSAQMVLKEAAQVPPTYRLRRGDFLDPDVDAGALIPGVPVALTVAGDPPAFANRLDLARWLVSPENPLTSRVTVNRIWMRYFGAGLVETENDFGSQGTLPSHPELLDWMATEFMEQGWSQKALHRLIVNSATYRQASDFREDLLRRDPHNRLLARQSRFRVEAEIVRDMSLAASGLLTEELGGPSVYPPQPEGIYSFTQRKKNWPESKGPDRYRRTMYTFLYRSAPYPLLTTFDAPDFSTSCTQRPRSDTPLQSLTLANDPMFLELAQGVADRMLKSTAGEKRRVYQMETLFRLCLTRDPSPQEVEVLDQYWAAEQKRFEKEPENAEVASRLITAKESQKIANATAAAWASVARVLMNSDEFVTRN